MSEPLTIRPYRAGDEHAILACYNRIFPTPDGRIPQRTLAQWRWRFLDNPTGLVHHVIAELADGSVVGAYAGLPVTIWCEGREQLCEQNVDLMVLPEWRRRGDRPGLFVTLGKKYYELWCGPEDGKTFFTYGWPVPAWRMGERYLGYVNMRDWDFVFREVGAPGFAPRATPNELVVRQVERYTRDVDALFETLAPSLQVALIRDARYLNWRYADCPDRRYRLYECRERASGALRGICVYAIGDVVRARTSFLVDWLARADDLDATVAMVATLEQQALLDRTGVLAAVFSHVDARFLAFQRLGFLVMGTSYFVVLALFRHDLTFFRERWYYTMGDSDLV